MFADRLKRRMTEAGVGLRQLARDTRIDASLLSKILAGKRPPPDDEDVLRRVAAALALDAVELIVLAGRIPAEWRAHSGNIEKVRGLHAALRRAASASAPAAPAVRAAKPVPLRPRPFAEELL